jgi:hypothetical protein
MSITRHEREEIVNKLRQVEVLVGQGMARIDDEKSADTPRDLLMGRAIQHEVHLSYAEWAICGPCG